jgi:hypothetical protein
MRSSTLSLASALDGGRWLTRAPAALPPVQRPSAYCVGGWVGLTAGLDGCGRCHSHRGSIPGSFSLCTCYAISAPPPRGTVFYLFHRAFGGRVSGYLNVAKGPTGSDKL